MFRAAVVVVVALLLSACHCEKVYNEELNTVNPPKPTPPASKPVTKPQTSAPKPGASKPTNPQTTKPKPATAAPKEPAPKPPPPPPPPGVPQPPPHQALNPPPSLAPELLPPNPTDPRIELPRNTDPSIPPGPPSKTQEVAVKHSYYKWYWKPRPICRYPFCPRPPVNVLLTVVQVAVWVAGFVLSLLREGGKGKVTVIPYGRTPGNNTLNVLLVKPYMQKNVRNAQHIRDRPAIWIEAGFEANLPAGVSTAVNLVDYLVNDCKMHCKYDYYIVPLANPDGYAYATTNKTWQKTRESFNGTDCKGVNLLNNFWYGKFADGDADPCSMRFRGPKIMSAVETRYQLLVKNNIKNIILSITLSKVGSKITMPYAHRTDDLSNYGNNKGYMEAFANAASGYEIGNYAQVHGKDYGHPLDYNYYKYKHSFNVAIENGTIGDDPYQHNGTQLAPIFQNFLQGLMGMITYAKKEQSLKF